MIGRKPGLVLCLISIVVMLAASIIFIVHVFQFWQNMDWVTESVRFNSCLKDIEIAVVDIESSQRAYIITGNTVHEQSFIASKDMLASKMQELRQLGDTKFGRQHACCIGTLEDRVNHKNMVIEETMQLARSGKLSRDLANEKTVYSLELKTELRKEVSRIDGNVKDNIDKHLKDALISSKQMTAVVINDVAVITFMVFMGMAIFRKHLFSCVARHV